MVRTNSHWCQVIYKTWSSVLSTWTISSVFKRLNDNKTGSWFVADSLKVLEIKDWIYLILEGYFLVLLGEWFQEEPFLDFDYANCGFRKRI